MAARVILAVPENNTTLNDEVTAYCTEFEIRLARVPRPPRPLDVPDLPAYRQSTLDTVRPLIGDGVDLVIYGCTSAGFLAGPEGNDAFVAALGDLVGSPVVSTANAMIQCLEASDAKRIDLLSPYVGWKNEKLMAYLRAYGITINNFDTFEAPNPTELGKITAEQVLEKARPIVAPDTDALFIACTQLPTRPVIAEMKREFRRPVWSASHATAWAALRELNLDADRLAA
jgi:maleate cis-trans isomerase